jgi:hypothetical protein
MGLCSATQKASGIFSSIKMLTEDVSEETANPFDIGQLFSAPESKSAEVLSSEQYSSDLDTDQRIMAQSY